MQTVSFGKGILRRESENDDANTASVVYANAMSRAGKKVVYVAASEGERPQNLKAEIQFMKWEEGQAAKFNVDLIVFNLDRSDPTDSLLKTCMSYRDNRVSSSVFTDSSSTVISRFVDREINRN